MAFFFCGLLCSGKAYERCQQRIDNEQTEQDCSKCCHGSGDKRLIPSGMFAAGNSLLSPLSVLSRSLNLIVVYELSAALHIVVFNPQPWHGDTPVSGRRLEKLDIVGGQ